MEGPMPSTARSRSQSVRPMPREPMPRELVLSPIEGGTPGRVSDAPERRSDRPGETSGLHRRSSIPSTPPEAQLTRRELALRFAIALVSVSGLAAVSARTWLALMRAELETAPAIVSVFGVLALAYFVTTMVRALRYRPVRDVSVWRLPTLTVIVPAYNEGAMVRRALESALGSGYPLDRLEILAIDDGSTDDTWAHIKACAEAAPDVVLAIRQPKNRGKREALRTGFVRARGEMIVTVDSDSQIEPGALESIVAPMVRDERVAAVAGRVAVLNRGESVLAELLSARFFLTFDLSRAAQSLAGAVLCTPGALSAYRASAVLDVLPRWSGQTFLGAPCTIAEDRALTSWLLRAGHRSVYQRTAVVATVVPTTIARAARMLVRWERGNLREDLVLLPALLGSWKNKDRVWPAIEMLVELASPPIAWLGLALLASEAWSHPGVLAFVLLSVLAGAAAQNLYVLRAPQLREFAWGVGYSIVATLALWWVTPYSLVTVRDGRWMTR